MSEKEAREKKSADIQERFDNLKEKLEERKIEVEGETEKVHRIEQGEKVLKKATDDLTSSLQSESSWAQYGKSSDASFDLSHEDSSIMLQEIKSKPEKFRNMTPEKADLLEQTIKEGSEQIKEVSAAIDRLTEASPSGAVSNRNSKIAIGVSVVGLVLTTLGMLEIGALLGGKKDDDDDKENNVDQTKLTILLEVIRNQLNNNTQTNQQFWESFSRTMTAQNATAEEQLAVLTLVESLTIQSEETQNFPILQKEDKSALLAQLMAVYDEDEPLKSLSEVYKVAADTKYSSNSIPGTTPNEEKDYPKSIMAGLVKLVVGLAVNDE